MPPQKPYNFDDPASLLDLGLRFFTPTEVARLHAFPIDGEADVHAFLDDSDRSSIGRHSFAFPEKLSLAQKWRLLGNSLNVRVVGVLMGDALFKYVR